MSLRINTNVTAMNALHNLEQTSASVSTSIERLSSGLRINRGADDPAGLIISEGLRAQIDGLNQAVANAQDANNLMKTAEGSLGEINSLLRSIRTLALHASNTGVNSGDSVMADQVQISSAIASIDRIAENTQFGTKKLLDGTSGTTATTTDTVRAASIYVGGTVDDVLTGSAIGTQSGDITVSVSQTAAQAFVAGTATYSALTATLGNAGTLVINSQSVTVEATDTVQTMIDRINRLSGTTKVVAFWNTDHVELKQQEYGQNGRIDWSQSSSLLSSGGAAYQSVTGTNAMAVVTIAGRSTGTWVGGQGADNGLRLTDAHGNSILLTETGNEVSERNVGHVNSGTMQFQIGANTGQTVNMDTGNVKTSELGKGVIAGKTVQNIDVTTAEGTQDALRILDAAINQVSVLRARIGSFQTNTLDSAIRFLGTSVENVSASESQIRDANVAQEVVKMTKNQIFQQAGMSVLGQANQAPQQVLSLLK